MSFGTGMESSGWFGCGETQSGRIPESAEKPGYFVSNGNFYRPKTVPIRCQTESGNYQTARIAKKAWMVVSIRTPLWRDSV